jgi:hypothetical protein
VACHKGEEASPSLCSRRMRACVLVRAGHFVCSGGRDVACGVVLGWAVALEAGAMTWGSSFQTEKTGFLRLVLREGQQHAHALALRVPCA